MNALDSLESKQLIVVTGKGGVGKSTVTAVLGNRMAARGRRVLLVEVDPRENLHHLFDVPPSGGEVVQVGPRLSLQHIEPRRLLDDLVRDKLRVGALVRRVLSSPVHQHFTEGAPGLKETAVFGRILRLVEGHVPRGMAKPDLVVLDAPATGHGVSWLAAPRLISEVIRSGPVGQMAAQIADFMDDASRFGLVVATSAEEMPVQECLELVGDLDRRGLRGPDLVVVNALYPPRTGARSAHADPARALWFQRRAINDRELERLAESWHGPTVQLPLLALDPGPPLVGALASALESAGGLR